MILWLYLHFPRLQLDALYGDDDLPVAIVDGKQPQLIQLNQAARTQGLKLGMGIGTAAALCRDLNLQPFNAQLEQEKLRQIADWLYPVTADICLFDQQGLLLKVSNMLSLYPSLSDYWQTVSQHLNTLGFHYQYASAYSPYAAMLLAQTGLNNVSDNADWLQQQLAKQPISLTTLPVKLVTKLNRVGVQWLAQLWSLPYTELAKRFDAELVTYVGRLKGQFHHPVTFYHPPEPFNQYLELLFDIENTAWLLKPLGLLLTKLERFLTLRNQLADAIDITLHLRDQPAQQISVVSAQGENKQASWLALAELHFERLTLDAPVMGISVKLIRYCACSSDSQDLFAGRRAAMSPLALISLLQAKLGKEQVCQLQLQQDHRPEQACQLRPFQAITPPAQPETFDKLRPSIMLSTPQPLTEQVSLLHGPERIITGWWDNQPVIRDYFIGHTKQGKWYWLYRTVEQQWFLHGLFS